MMKFIFVFVFSFSVLFAVEPDYTGVLNQIDTNTNQIDDTSLQIKEMLAADTVSPFATPPDDGSSTFSDSQTEITSTFSSFNLADPLNIVSSSPVIETFSFNILGQSFVLMDSSTLNSLPLDTIRSLFLFVAAIGGLVSVLVGGI